MIQRIQSVYFFIATIFLLIYAFMCDHSILQIATNFTQNLIPAMGSVVVAFLSLIIIFLFKKRNFQTKLSSFLMLIIIGIIAYFIYSFGIKLFYKEWSFYLLPLALVFLFLARKSVIKDEKLIKSVDRLR